jgi:c(7)-type cytochrome triheme protein
MTKTCVYVAGCIMMAQLLAGCAPAPPQVKTAMPPWDQSQPPPSPPERAPRTGQLVDYAALAKILDIIPPNGPFWRYGTVLKPQRRQQTARKPAVFAHWSHRAKYTCRVCHLELGFSMRAGDTGITRQQYLSGKYCGACHDGKTAFTVQDGPQAACARCHMENPQLLAAALEKVAATMPVSNSGNGIDWAKAMREGKITPIATLTPEQRRMPLPEKLRQPLKLGTTSPGSAVTFSHEQHYSLLDCSGCHPDIFAITKQGTQFFSMEANVYGGFCGACHMTVAFPMGNCQRCHPSMSNYN